MQLQFKLEEQDFLNFQLYCGDKSRDFFNFRFKYILNLTIFYVVVNIFLFINKSFFYFNENIPYYFTVMSIISLLYCYFFYSKIYYKKNIIKNLDKLYEQNIDKISTIQFEKEKIIKTDSYSKYETEYNSIEFIEELKDYFYFKIKSGVRIIVPKSSFQSVENYKTLKDLILAHNILLINEKEWKW
jgi:uncharacterized membrane protein